MCLMFRPWCKFQVLRSTVTFTKVKICLFYTISLSTLQILLHDWLSFSSNNHSMRFGFISKRTNQKRFQSANHPCPLTFLLLRLASMNSVASNSIVNLFKQNSKPRTKLFIQSIPSGFTEDEFKELIKNYISEIDYFCSNLEKLFVIRMAI